jgi:hypothetical protein
MKDLYSNVLRQILKESYDNQTPEEKKAIQAVIDLAHAQGVVDEAMDEMAIEKLKDKVKFYIKTGVITLGLLTTGLLHHLESKDDKDEVKVEFYKIMNGPGAKKFDKDVADLFHKIEQNSKGK